MKVERLRRLARIERDHFWFAGRRALIDRLLERYLSSTPVILDAGCGTGAMAERLSRRGYSVVGFDLRPEGLIEAKRARPEAAFFQAEAARFPLPDSTFNCVLALDVFEHVDDCAMMAEIVRVLRPDGYLILTVPALPYLWSYRDEAAGHLRRYTKSSLEMLINQARMEIREIGYYQCLLLPLVVVTRRLARKNAAWRDVEDLPSPPVNRLLTMINLAEVSLRRYIAWPSGSSLVAVCRKKSAV